MKFLLLILSVLAVFGKRDEEGNKIKMTAEERAERKAAAIARGRVPREQSGTRRPFVVESAKTVGKVKVLVDARRDDIVALATSAEKKALIEGEIGTYLEGDADRENTPENVALIYNKLIAKKSKDNEAAGKNPEGFYKKLHKYQKQQVKDLRKEKQRELFAAAQLAFLAEVNAIYDGPDYTVATYKDAIKTVQAAKGEAKRAAKEATRIAEGGKPKKGYKGASKKHKEVFNTKAALKAAKKQSKSFLKQAKYGTKNRAWANTLKRENQALDNSLKQLENGYKLIGKACQRIKIDLRKEEVGTDNQLDEFVKRLAARSLEGWSQHILTKNDQGMTSCLKAKIDAHYAAKKLENTNAKTAAQEKFEGAEATWGAQEFTSKAEAKIQFTANGENNGDKKARLQQALDDAKAAYDTAYANVLAAEKASGLGNIKIVRNNAYWKPAAREINRKSGISRAKKTP